MPASLEHNTLGATLRGLEFGDVWQFRGLQYATISERFAAPGPPTALSGSVDCTSYGYVAQDFDIFLITVFILRKVVNTKSCNIAHDVPKIR